MLSECFWGCVFSLIVGLLLGLGSRLWSMPIHRKPISVGDLVRVRAESWCSTLSRDVYRVTGECGCPGHGRKRSLFIQRVTPGDGVLSAWLCEQDIEGTIATFEPPTEEEARELNNRFSITCSTHALEDCTSKARQREALGLPGHQS